ncbi:MAG TPA: xanthine dehydrogenase family protein subunit M [bacterium]|nr:xanthine dehydrogenase family protein subunit M [bacterium]
MQNLTYHAPGTVAEAVALMRADPAHSRYLAGGTDLYLALEHRLPDVHTVIDLKQIPELDGIGVGPGTAWRIGALTRMADIEHHPDLRARFPALCAAAAVVGGPPVRNRATLGGNLCNASPAADTATPLLALAATVSVADGDSEHSLPLAELARGPRETTLAPGAIVTAIGLPAPAPRSGNAFARLTRSAMDIALVNAAAAVVLDEDGRAESVTVALGAVGPTVILVSELDAALAGKPLDDEALDEVRAQAEAAARPIDDVRASAGYRAEMAGVLAARAVRDAAAMALGETR